MYGNGKARHQVEEGRYQSDYATRTAYEVKPPQSIFLLASQRFGSISISQRLDKYRTENNLKEGIPRYSTGKSQVHVVQYSQIHQASG